MKSISTFRNKLSAGDCLYGLWVSLEAGAVTDVAAGLGLDWVVIDAASGHLDWSETGEHLRALKRSRTVALVQIADATISQIDRAFQLGADGILVRGVRTAGELSTVVTQANAAAMKAQAVSAWKHTVDAGSPLVIPVVGPENPHDELLEAESIDICFWDLTQCGPEWKQQAAQIVSRNKHVVVVARTDEEILECRALGISMVGLGSDAGIIFEGMRAALASCRTTPSSPGARS